MSSKKPAVKKEAAKRILKPSKERLISAISYWLMPLMLGLIIGCAVFIFLHVYLIINSMFSFIVDYNPLLIMVCPAIALSGGYIIVKLFADYKNCGCGGDVMIEHYHKKYGFISLSDTISKTMASAVTIGFGGSAGLEGPSLLLGGGLSSFITRKLGLDQKDVKKLFLCGAAAGFSAIFRAPLTGILFALEIPYKKDIETEVFIPASIASVSAYIVSALTIGVETIFPSPPSISLSFVELLHIILLGILSAIVALVFITTFEKINAASRRISRVFPMALLSLCVGLLLGVVGLFYPGALGLGYEIIHGLTSSSMGQLSTAALLIIVFMKMLTTSLTLSFGGSGGLFIPSLYIGGVFGLFYAKLLGLAPLALYSIVGMAAVLAATSKSLLTSITLVAETVGPSFIIFTVISATISYFLTGNRSLYRSQHIRRTDRQAFSDMHAKV